MKIYPSFYLNSIIDITIGFLQQNGIRGLILDVDNTLIDYEKNLVKGTQKWIEELKANDIKLCILSNSNQKQKVETVANKLQIPYFYFAKKPLKTGFKKAKQKLQLENKEIAVVGDQIFTDVIGANRSKMIAILVKPIGERDIWITKIKRPIENYIIKKYQNKQKRS